jgi:hypothetical protein
VGLERNPLSLVSATEELLERKSSGSDIEIRDYGHRGSVTLTMWHPLSVKVGTNFFRQAALARYSSLEDSDHRVCLFVCLSFAVMTWIYFASLNRRK